MSISIPPVSDSHGDLFRRARLADPDVPTAEGPGNDLQRNPRPCDAGTPTVGQAGTAHRLREFLFEDAETGVTLYSEDGHVIQGGRLPARRAPLLDPSRASARPS